MAVIYEGHNPVDVFCPPCHRTSVCNFRSRDELMAIVFKGMFDEC